MFEKIIEKNVELLLESLNDLPDMTINSLLLSNALPEVYKNMIVAERDIWIYKEKLKLKGNPFFHFPDKENEDYVFVDEILRKYAIVPFDDLEQFIRSLVSLRLNYIIRPRTTLKYFIFKESLTVSPEEFIKYFGFFLDYEYLFRNFYDHIARADESGKRIFGIFEFDQLISKFDNTFLFDLNIDDLTELLSPIFQFFNPGYPEDINLCVPTDALILFFDDKNMKYVSSVLLSKFKGKTINKNELIDLFNSTLQPAFYEDNSDAYQIPSNDLKIDSNIENYILPDISENDINSIEIGENNETLPTLETSFDVNTIEEDIKIDEYGINEDVNENELEEVYADEFDTFSEELEIIEEVDDTPNINSEDTQEELEIDLSNLTSENVLDDIHNELDNIIGGYFDNEYDVNSNELGDDVNVSLQTREPEDEIQIEDLEFELINNDLEFDNEKMQVIDKEEDETEDNFEMQVDSVINVDNEDILNNKSTIDLEQNAFEIEAKIDGNSKIDNLDEVSAHLHKESKNIEIIASLLDVNNVINIELCQECEYQDNLLLPEFILDENIEEALDNYLNSLLPNEENNGSIILKDAIEVVDTFESTLNQELFVVSKGDFEHTLSIESDNISEDDRFNNDQIDNSQNNEFDLNDEDSEEEIIELQADFLDIKERPKFKSIVGDIDNFAEELINSLEITDTSEHTDIESSLDNYDLDDIIESNKLEINDGSESIRFNKEIINSIDNDKDDYTETDDKLDSDIYFGNINIR